MIRQATHIPEGIDIPVWVFSNDRNMYGASVIGYPDFFEEVRKTVGGSCYLLPSSVNEIILATFSEIYPSVRHMTETVRRNNVTAIPPQEKLSDNVFYVDVDKKTITVAN